MGRQAPDIHVATFAADAHGVMQQLGTCGLCVLCTQLILHEPPAHACMHASTTPGILAATLNNSMRLML